MTEEVKVDKLTESPIFVYKQFSPGDNFHGKFTALNALEISSIDQRYSDDGKEFVCLTMSGVTETSVMGHHHLDVRFHEIMLRWTALLEGK